MLLGDVLTHLGMETTSPRGSTASISTQGKHDSIDIKHDQQHQTSRKDNEAIQALMDIINISIFGHKEDIWNPIDALTNCNNLLPLFEHVDMKNRIYLAKQTLEKICNPNRTHGSISSKRYSEEIHEDNLSNKFTEPFSVTALIYLCAILSDSIDALTIQGTNF